MKELMSTSSKGELANFDETATTPFPLTEKESPQFLLDAARQMNYNTASKNLYQESQDYACTSTWASKVNDESPWAEVVVTSLPTLWESPCAARIAHWRKRAYAKVLCFEIHNRQSAIALRNIVQYHVYLISNQHVSIAYHNFDDIYYNCGFYAFCSFFFGFIHQGRHYYRIVT